MTNSRRAFLPIVSLTIASLLVSTYSSESRGEDTEKLPGWGELEGSQKSEGFFDIAWQEADGKLLCRVEPEAGGEEPFLLITSLVSGMGSNPVGLDRGQIRGQRMVQWERYGRKAILRQLQTGFRASGSEAEQGAVSQSFASSVLIAAEVVAEDDSSYAVDITPLLVRDDDGIARQLQSAGEKGFKLNESRSIPLPASVKSFPNNTELECLLTFTSDTPGKYSNFVAPEATAISLQRRLSFVALPPLGEYQAREWHPNSGCFSVDFIDYSAELGEPMEKRLLVRHRVSRSEPLIYYVDHAAPPEIRQALVDGASWWADAFKAAGLPGGFQVKILPEDADPLDVRYNVIQWVHRRTRGWSYGNSVVDPRTGEILKGHVSLGSLRVRQDQRLLGNLPTSLGSRNGCACCGIAPLQYASALETLADPLVAKETALARIRQLSAHEVGHTLGFAHNFAGSTIGRASVMDYPAPLITLDEAGQISMADAYDVGIGRWDEWTVRFAYGKGSERQFLLRTAAQDGLVYLTDSDARPANSADPRASLWDNGADQVEELGALLKIRKAALANFNLGVLGDAEPVTNLEVNLVPLYLMHRYQVEAVSKMLGGKLIQRGLREDFSKDAELVADVPFDQQRQALATLLETIDPANLGLPQSILKQLPPAATSSPLDRERFESYSAPITDPISLALVAADISFDGLLQPQRAARMMNLSAEDLRFNSLLSLVTNKLFSEKNSESDLALIRVALRGRWVQRLIELHNDAGARFDVRAAAYDELLKLNTNLREQPQFSDFLELRRIIDTYINRSSGPAPKLNDAFPTPPGSPIGN